MAMGQSLAETMKGARTTTAQGMDLHWEVLVVLSEHVVLLQLWTSPAGLLEGSMPPTPAGSSWIAGSHELPF